MPARNQVAGPEAFAGELIYQGVASTASHVDFDNTLQGDLTYQLGSHTLGAGFYLGDYRVIAEDSSLVFPVDANGNQTSDQLLLALLEKPDRREPSTRSRKTITNSISASSGR